MKAEASAPLPVYNERGSVAVCPPRYSVFPSKNQRPASKGSFSGTGH